MVLQEKFGWKGGLLKIIKVMRRKSKLSKGIQ